MGATALDVSGLSNHATLTGATWSGTGKYGTAISFDGVNDWLTVADAASLDLTSGMTLEAWVRPSALNSWETVLMKEAGTDLTYSIYADNNGNDSGGPRLPAGYIRQSSGAYSAVGASQLTLDTWAHLAATYDGTALRFYVNGVLATTLNRTGSINTSTGPLRVGGNAVWGEYFNGLIDEVRVYDHALSQSEILTDMYTPIADNTPPTITARNPAPGAINVASTANVLVTFSETLNPATVTTATFELRDADLNVLPASVSYDPATFTVTLDPVSNLAPSGIYSVMVYGGTSSPRVQDVAGNPLAVDASWSFTVAPLSISINDVSVTEGHNGTVNTTFTVTLSGSNPQPVTVRFSSAPGTATSGVDYTEVPLTDLTFDPGEISKPVTVVVNGDVAGEGNETFFVNLSDPTNAILGDSQGLGTIVDDDASLIGSEGFGYRAWTSTFEAIDLVPGAAGVFTIRATGNNNANLVTLSGSNRFNFYGTSYASFYVSTNGLITFGASNTSASNANLTTSPAQRALAPLWDDWVHVSGQTMLLGKYEDTTGDGTSDRLIIEWNNVQGNSSSPSPITFQTVLQLNTGTVPGEFFFNYPDLDAGNGVSNGASATVGIKDTGTQGTRRLLISHNATGPFVGSGKAIAFMPDTTLPSVAVTAPANNATVAGTVSVTASADDDTAVAGVQFLLGGANLGAEDTTSPYSVSWNTTALANGTYVLTARARDAAGNVTTSSPITVTVANAGDTTPPTVAITAPANGATVSGVNVAVSAAASDNVGVVGVQFRLDGVNYGAEDTTAPYAITWDTTAVANGTHQLTAFARDAAGNTTLSTVVSVTVSNNDPAQIGQWSNVMSFPLVAMNTVLLLDGRVLMWDGGPACIGSTSPRVWDPVSNTFTAVPIPYFNNHDDDIFCSAQALLADGRVLVVGGHDCDGPQLGIKMVNIFDPVTLTWTRGPDMAYRRWYPTATTLADGRVLVTAGSVNTTTDYVPFPEIYDPVTNSWTTLVSANKTIPNYPFVFQTPDGKVLVAGSDEAKMATYSLDVAAQTWTTIDSRVLDAGSAVMYRPGQVMKAGSSYLSPPADNGGNIPSSALTYVLNANQVGAQWQQTASMAFPRTHLNLTLLPDGNVLSTGGSSNIGGVDPAAAVLPAELWSPTTQTWTTLASQQRPRMYHSTALLLPDGRVMTAGSGHNFFNSHAEFNAEIYSPAYLFKGARPTITSIPSTLAYGSNFFVATPDAASITSVALIRNGSATHAFNMDQRFVPLSYTPTTGGLTVQAPADAILASPGHYMLFLVNSNGVPSVAPFVRLPAPYEDSVPPTAPTDLIASGSISSVSLGWTAASDNVAVSGYHIHRATTPNFTASAGNRVGQATGTSYVDNGLGAGTYYYQVVAYDAAGNLSPASNEASAIVTGDVTAPTVSLTAPTNGATVSGSVTVSADASDNVGVVGVQFFLDSVALGSEDATAPYSISWNTALVANGNHTLTARARDASGNTTLSTPITVNVNNTAPSGLVLALGLNEGTGTSAVDTSGRGNHGTLSGAAWNGAGKYGGALSFDGINDWLTIADAASLDLTTGMTLEAWVRPSALNSWETVILKEAGSQLAYGLYADDNGNDSGAPRRPGIWVQQGSTSYSTLGTAQLIVNTWAHLAATYDGTALRFYVNGALATTLNRTGSINTSTGPLRVGGNAVWGEYFNGLIDEVRVYNRALSVTEIQTDMNTPVGTGLQAAFPAPATTQTSLTWRALESIRREALERWHAFGLSPQDLARLHATPLLISNLPGSYLGLTDAGRIWIDTTAAGLGWYVDPRPQDDREFSSLPNRRLSGRFDLLTVLMHEYGHVLGLGHDHHGIMSPELTPGTRRLPGSEVTAREFVAHPLTAVPTFSVDANFPSQTKVRSSADSSEQWSHRSTIHQELARMRATTILTESRQHYSAMVLSTARRRELADLVFACTDIH